MPVKRYELSDAQWLKIASLLPDPVLDAAALTTGYSSMAVFGLALGRPLARPAGTPGQWETVHNASASVQCRYLGAGIRSVDGRSR